MDDFVSIHNHTEYSLLDGVGHPSDFVKRAKELGQSAIGITEHGNVSSHRRLVDACKKEGIKPLLGCEFYVCDDVTQKSRTRWHITAIAKTLVGYRNLLKLVTLSWDEHHFYYKPLVDWSMLKRHHEGIIATSGCPSGKIGKGIQNGEWSSEMVAKELKRQAAIFGAGNYFAELSHWNFEGGIKVAKAVYRVAMAEGIPMVMTIDAHYPTPDKARVQDIKLCIQNNTTFNNPERMRFTQDDYCLWSGADMVKKWMKIHGKSMAAGLDEMILNTKRIADSVNFEFPSAVPLAFKYDADKKELLRKLCSKGMKMRGVAGKKNYEDRLQYEFNLVCEKNFIDYFLVVQDLIVWAKNQDILVGAARGSSCGSLMCYVLRITEIDPMIHGLMFERFIDVTRGGWKYQKELEEHGPFPPSA